MTGNSNYMEHVFTLWANYCIWEGREEPSMVNFEPHAYSNEYLF